MNIIKFKNENITIEYHNFNNGSTIDVNLELLRCDYYHMIIDSFIATVQKYFESSIFSKKKPFKRALSNIFSNFIFSQYRKNNNQEDIFIPKITDLDFIKNVFLDYLKINNKNSDNLELFSKDFLNIYSKNYKTFILKKKKLKFKAIDIKSRIIFIKNSKFIKLFPNKIFNKDYEVVIFYDKYIELKNKFISKNKGLYFNSIIYSILLRYFTLGSNNNQLAVSPKKMVDYTNKYSLSFETFASAINHQTEYFCSVYPDIEKYFGSLGNFFNAKMIRGCYNFNPPFQEDIINDGIKKILLHLDEGVDNLTFIITIPVWDIEGKKQFGIVDGYSDLPIISKIKQSKYLVSIEAISKEEFDYHDHIFNLVKNVTIQNTYQIILSNHLIKKN